jgi:hypothetical protein
LTLELPNSTVVVGRPSTPAEASGVPTGLVVTSAGRWLPFTLQDSASASAQNG